jgi:phage shock protein A
MRACKMDACLFKGERMFTETSIDLYSLRYCASMTPDRYSGNKHNNLYDLSSLYNKTGVNNMGLLNRMGTVVKSKMNKLVTKMENPLETLDYSYEKQLELLQNVKRGVAEVTTSKKRLELQRAKLKQNIDKLSAQAKTSVTADREDLARLALERKNGLLMQVQGLDQQISDLEKEQEKLMAAEKRLSAKVESFRTKKETIKAQYSAAEAQVKITESLSGISEEMADVGLAVRRSEEKTENMKARSAALDELLEEGTLEDFTGREDDIEKELSRISATSSIESELESLKKEAGK